ncbi:hypothetical protein BX600DRAFT_451841 [Xylariales sp. PMI_506]|nr:hypothetical protein BX600DRAFT_451841 [Xylariales sp. PMI_506]
MRSALDSKHIPDSLLLYFVSNKTELIAPILNPRGGFNSPVLTIGGLNFTGISDISEYQAKALAEVLRIRGGIASVKIPGVAEHLQTATLVHASHRLQRPCIELCTTFSLTLEHLRKSRLPMADVKMQSFAHVDAVLRDIIMDLKQCCKLVDAHCDHKDAGTQIPFEVRLLGQCRDVVQYRLLNIDRRPSPSTISQLAIMIFSYGVTYPLPNHEPIQRLSRYLWFALQNQVCLVNQPPELLLWAANMGAMAIIGSVEMSKELQFFLERIADLSKLLRVNDWVSFKALMEEFVWLDRACDQGGEIIWANSCERGCKELSLSVKYAQ